ncbi:NrsF family protein [Asticcacaulis solisilvae]|uniref:NrsF family protein n=1 Tax=Asticcacaulis solisilvae TaxID=1217274 RepID=UPI003FD6F997
MSDASDKLIDDLADGLRPVRPLKASPMWLAAAAALVLAALYIFFYYGPRPEIAAMVHGQSPRTMMAWFKPLLFVVTGAGAFWAVADLARPEGRLRVRTLLPLILALAIEIVALLRDAMMQPSEVMTGLHQPAILCMTTIVCGGLAGLIVLWRLWLRRAATSHPVLLGALAGLATGSLMAAAYAVHCDRDWSSYILVYYAGGVAITSAIAAALGKRFLRW